MIIFLTCNFERMCRSAQMRSGSIICIVKHTKIVCNCVKHRSYEGGRYGRAKVCAAVSGRSSESIVNFYAICVCLDFGEASHICAKAACEEGNWDDLKAERFEGEIALCSVNAEW